MWSGGGQMQQVVWSLERMRDELTRRIYKSGMDDVCVRGRPPIKWENRMLEYFRGGGIGG